MKYWLCLTIVLRVAIICCSARCLKHETTEEHEQSGVTNNREYFKEKLIKTYKNGGGSGNETVEVMIRKHKYKIPKRVHKKYFITLLENLDSEEEINEVVKIIRKPVKEEVIVKKLKVVAEQKGGEFQKRINKMIKKRVEVIKQGGNSEFKKTVHVEESTNNSDGDEITEVVIRKNKYKLPKRVVRKKYFITLLENLDNEEEREEVLKIIRKPKVKEEVIVKKLKVVAEKKGGEFQKRINKMIKKRVEVIKQGGSEDFKRTEVIKRETHNSNDEDEITEINIHKKIYKLPKRVVRKKYFITLLENLEDEEERNEVIKIIKKPKVKEEVIVKKLKVVAEKKGGEFQKRINKMITKRTEVIKQGGSSEFKKTVHVEESSGGNDEDEITEVQIHKHKYKLPKRVVRKKYFISLLENLDNEEEREEVVKIIKKPKVSEEVVVKKLKVVAEKKGGEFQKRINKMITKRTEVIKQGGDSEFKKTVHIEESTNNSDGDEITEVVIRKNKYKLPKRVVRKKYFITLLENLEDQEREEVVKIIKKPKVSEETVVKKLKIVAEKKGGEFQKRINKMITKRTEVIKQESHNSNDEDEITEVVIRKQKYKLPKRVVRKKYYIELLENLEDQEREEVVKIIKKPKVTEDVIVKKLTIVAEKKGGEFQKRINKMITKRTEIIKKESHTSGDLGKKVVEKTVIKHTERHDQKPKTIKKVTKIDIKIHGNKYKIPKAYNKSYYLEFVRSLDEKHRRKVIELFQTEKEMPEVEIVKRIREYTNSQGGTVKSSFELLIKKHNLLSQESVKISTGDEIVIDGHHLPKQVGKHQLIHIIRQFDGSVINVKQLLIKITQITKIETSQTTVHRNYKNVNLYDKFFGEMMNKVGNEYQKNVSSIVKKDGLTKKEVFQSLEKWAKKRGKSEMNIYTKQVEIIETTEKEDKMSIEKLTVSKRAKELKRKLLELHYDRDLTLYETCRSKNMLILEYGEETAAELGVQPNAWCFAPIKGGLSKRCRFKIKVEKRVKKG